MSETEAPTEHLHEHIQEGAEHSHTRWIVWVALSTAILAVLAAISSLLANHHSDEALLCQIKSSDAWSYYQAKGIKTDILLSTQKLLIALGKEKIDADEKKVEANRRQQEVIRLEAEGLEKQSEQHVHVHAALARSVTIFQIAIAMSAITILTKRKVLWFLSLGFSALAIFFLIIGLMN